MHAAAIEALKHFLNSGHWDSPPQNGLIGLPHIYTKIDVSGQFQLDDDGASPGCWSVHLINHKIYSCSISCPPFFVILSFRTYSTPLGHWAALEKTEATCQSQFRVSMKKVYFIERWLERGDQVIDLTGEWLAWRAVKASNENRHSLRFFNCNPAAFCPKVQMISEQKLNSSAA